MAGSAPEPGALAAAVAGLNRLRELIAPDLPDVLPRVALAPGGRRDSALARLRVEILRREIEARMRSCFVEVLERDAAEPDGPAAGGSHDLVIVVDDDDTGSDARAGSVRLDGACPDPLVLAGRVLTADVRAARLAALRAEGRAPAGERVLALLADGMAADAAGAVVSALAMVEEAVGRTEVVVIELDGSAEDDLGSVLGRALGGRVPVLGAELPLEDRVAALAAGAAAVVAAGPGAREGTALAAAFSVPAFVIGDAEPATSWGDVATAVQGTSELAEAFGAALAGEAAPPALHAPLHAELDTWLDRATDVAAGRAAAALEGELKAVLGRRARDLGDYLTQLERADIEHRRRVRRERVDVAERFDRMRLAVEEAQESGRRARRAAVRLERRGQDLREALVASNAALGRHALALAAAAPRPVAVPARRRVGRAARALLRGLRVLAGGRA
jgi:hypothetical protein